MENLNGEIMSGNKSIATVRNGLLIESDMALLPLYLKRTRDVESWLRSRAIDPHRTNSLLLKKTLRLSAANDAEVALRVSAASITDTYWFRNVNSGQKYEDVRFKANYFDKLALYGDPDCFNQPYSPTPELTNIGSFEKCWRLTNGKWWMVKQGNSLERFSELFIYIMGQMLGFPMAQYQVEDGIIISPDFTDGAAVNYEAADGIVGDDEDYGYNFEAFWSLSPELAAQYMQIIYMDTLCFNMDRHTKNYGVLRNVDSGDILRMAPNFDNNIALFARGIPTNLVRSNDKLISFFIELLERDDRALEIARRLPVPTQEMVEECVRKTNMPVDVGSVCSFIMNGSSHVQSGIQSLVC